MTARKPLPPPDGAEALTAALARRLEHPPAGEVPEVPDARAAVPAVPPSPRPAARAATPPAGADMDAAQLGRWRWQLGATARKAVAARSRADAAAADWDRLVADAAAAGVPGRLVVAAAADAGLESPAPR
jgi:hypothetical protein